jgi:hypothetical protein
LDEVTVAGAVVVAWAMQVRWHNAYEVHNLYSTILSVVSFTELHFELEPAFIYIYPPWRGMI